MNSSDIRQRFVDYYAGLGFQQLPRAPMLHPSIPMSFVMSAGLVQVETSLAHAEDRSSDQFVLVQECFRHFDLDRVGTNSIHLSLFEMPGAFVFGPDGKRSTVERMWTLATAVLDIDEEHIWASYFGGGPVLEEELPGDEMVRDAWLDVGVPRERLVGLGAEDNYWVQGGGIDGMETPRKAGPNTELFYDRGPEYACGPACRPGCRCGRFVEFSNSLFISQEIDTDNGSLHPLEEPFSETVIGTERVAMILQGVESVFRIDGYRPIMAAIRAFVDAPDLPESTIAASEQVIADYLKALYVLVGDGAPPPGKNGRERIIKLLIRGVVSRQILLGIRSDDFLTTVMGRIDQTLQQDLRAAPKDERVLIDYFESESERFIRTIRRGRRALGSMLKENAGHTLTGQQILDLEKKKGLPHLLTAKFLKEKGLAFRESDYLSALSEWETLPHN